MTGVQTCALPISTQIARVLTEGWVNNEAFCPNCGKSSLNKYANNRPVADFYCSGCREEYELKSKKGGFGLKIVDGAYHTMIDRLQSRNNPNFFLLNYDLQHREINNFLVIPKHFFLPEIIEKRKPLGPSARRAGWTGCNILLQSIPQSGKIYFVRDKKVIHKEQVIENWQKTLFLREEKKTKSKGWLIDIMRCIDQLGKKEFKLDDLYSFESHLKRMHPENNHIRDKIRQQLQVLRDKQYLEFISRGLYRLS